MKNSRIHNKHISIDFFSAYIFVMYGKIGKDNDDYVNGQGFCCNDAPGLRSFGSGQNDNPELFQYYYHSDHLGSTGLITNLDGETVQHIEYVPFGEVFIEERNNTWNTPYLFNAKELDEETGLYYYGARYYDPRISLWLSADPMQEKYPHISTYAYAALNPVKFIDPTGMGWIESSETGDITWDKDVNSQKDFDGKYDKSKFSYMGQEFQRAYSLGSTAGLYTQYYGADGNTSIYDYPMWVEYGKSHIGLMEGGNVTIQSMIDKLNADFGYTDKQEKPIKNDAEPWCGVFVYSSLIDAGQLVTSNSWKTPAKNTFYSENWKEGIVISDPKYGAIAVMSYGHVAIVVGFDDKNVWILGGNQPQNGATVRDGVEVNITKYKRSLVSKYVIPDGYNAPPLSNFK